MSGTPTQYKHNNKNKSDDSSRTCSSDETAVGGSTSTGSSASAPYDHGDKDDDDDNGAHGWTWTSSDSGNEQNLGGANGGRQNGGGGCGGGGGGHSSGARGGGGGMTRSRQSAPEGNEAIDVQSNQPVRGGGGDSKDVCDKGNADKGGSTAMMRGGRSPERLHPPGIASGSRRTPAKQVVAEGASGDRNGRQNRHDEGSRETAGHVDRRASSQNNKRNGAALSKPITILPVVRQTARRSVIASASDTPSSVGTVAAAASKLATPGIGPSRKAETGTETILLTNNGATIASKERKVPPSLPPPPATSFSPSKETHAGENLAFRARQQRSNGSTLSSCGSISTVAPTSANSSFSDCHLHSKETTVSSPESGHLLQVQRN